MRILFLSDNFPPEVNAPASRTYEHCREWARAGHQVTVITCAPNFPRGKVFAGYRNRLCHEQWIDGIRVIRVWTYIAANEGIIRRSLDYLSFMLSATVAGLFVRKIDVVVGTSPQFFTVCAAYLVSALKRVPFVFELRDLWPASISAVGVMRESRLLRWFERAEMFLYRKAACIVSVTHSFRHILEQRGIDVGKIVVVTNGVDISRFAPRPRDSNLSRELGLDGKFVTGYIGTHGLAHALSTLLQAAHEIQGISEGRDVQFVFLGDGAEKDALVREARLRKLNNTLFLGTVPRERVPQYWSLFDVSIIHLRRNEVFTTVIPSKLFESMAMGIPVLHGVEGESAEIVMQEQIGKVFEPENVSELVEALLAMKDDAAQLARCRARALAAVHQYDRSALAQKMLNAIKSVALHATNPPKIA